MTRTAQTVTLIDRIAANIMAGSATIGEQWDGMTDAERALFDSRADYLHAVMAELDSDHQDICANFTDEMSGYAA